MLVDSAVVDGLKPAMYYSRGEGGAFYSALAAEEELATSTDTSAPTASADLHRRAEHANEAREEGEEELARDVDVREEERNRKVNAREGSAGFP